jgi:hypothetical protein
MPQIKTPQDNDPGLAPIDSIINEAASFIGGSADPRSRKMVEDALDRSARRMNLAGLYLFNYVTQEYTTGVTPGDFEFTTGQAHLVAPADFGWPTDPFITKTSASETLSIVEWLSWNDFQKMQNSGSAAGAPQYASIMNEFEDTTNMLPKIHFWPKVDTNMVSTMEMSYFRRITKPSQARDGSSLYLTDETLECLLTGAEYFIMRHRYKENPRMWKEFQQEFTRCMTQARAASSRRQQAFHSWMWPDETGNLSVNPYQYVGSRPTYLLI